LDAVANQFRFVVSVVSSAVRGSEDLVLCPFQLLPLR